MHIATDATPWYKQRWPWLLMLGPAIVISGSIYTSYLAFSAPDPVVVGDYYKKGKAINQDLSRDRVASAMGLSLTLGYDANRGMLTGQIRRSIGAAEGGQSERLLLRLSHATLPQKDIELPVQPDASGAFALNLPMLERSRWVVLVEGEQRNWRLAGAWTWPRERSVTLLADAPPMQ
ncbi:MAG: FixH family protein [Duganella sp.]